MTIFVDASALVAMIAKEPEATSFAKFLHDEPIDADLALDAHARFGKGIDPAALNFGDCFAYAAARRSDAALLFKGDDFAQTDIRDATLE